MQPSPFAGPRTSFSRGPDPFPQASFPGMSVRGWPPESFPPNASISLPKELMISIEKEDMRGLQSGCLPQRKGR